MNQVTDDIMHLGPFFWAEDERPRVPADVLLTVPRTPRPGKVVLSAAADEDDNKQRKK